MSTRSPMSLVDLLKQKTPCLFDGAMGTELAAAGLEMGGQINLRHPDEVLRIHRAYSQIGCDFLITNTLTMNRIYIETHKVGVDVSEVNLVGVKLAKAAATCGQYVLGDISSTGKMLEPYGEYTEAQFHETFKEQAQYLAEGGVDGFIVETMFDLREAICAVRACRAVAPLPVVACLAFHTPERGGRTIMGNTAADSAKALVEAGACAVGANCGQLSPREMAIVVARMREVASVPIVAQPNAGKPQLVEGRTAFRMQPIDFADGIVRCLDSGASAVGGCCGTTPEHIRCVAQVIEKRRSNQGNQPIP